MLSLFLYYQVGLASSLAIDLQIGDWVLRSGRGQESALIKAMSKSEFSHIGMIVAVKPQVVIVHATTNDDEQHPNQVLSSTLEQFSAYELTNRVVVVRPTFITVRQKQKIAEHMKKLVGQSFKLTSLEDSPRYCTTIIYDSIRHEYPDFELPWQTVLLPIAGGKYLFPQVFFEYKDGELIYDSVH